MATLTNFARQFEGLSGLPVARQISLLILIAVTLAAISVAVLWGRAPAFQTFHVPGSDREASTIAQALTRANISYRIESTTGAFQVPASQLREARMQLANQGVAGTGSRDVKGLAPAASSNRRAIKRRWRANWSDRSMPCPESPPPACTWRCRNSRVSCVTAVRRPLPCWSHRCRGGCWGMGSVSP